MSDSVSQIGLFVGHHPFGLSHRHHGPIPVSRAGGEEDGNEAEAVADLRRQLHLLPVRQRDTGSLQVCDRNIVEGG